MSRPVWFLVPGFLVESLHVLLSPIPVFTSPVRALALLSVVLAYLIVRRPLREQARTPGRLLWLAAVVAGLFRFVGWLTASAIGRPADLVHRELAQSFWLVFPVGFLMHLSFAALAVFCGEWLARRIGR